MKLFYHRKRGYLTLFFITLVICYFMVIKKDDSNSDKGHKDDTNSDKGHKDEKVKNVDSFIEEQNGVNLTEYHLPLIDMPAMHRVTRLFYNRVPKCASVTVGGVMANLVQHTKRFVYYASRQYYPEWLDTEQQQLKVADYVQEFREPFLYNRHLCFLDFEKLGYPKTTYINVVREPISRFVSNYYYQHTRPRKNKRPKAYSFSDINHSLENNFTDCTRKGAFLTIDYFCGNEPVCRQHTAAALQKAKQNAARHYAVVGVTHDLKLFFEILECVLPQYFSGVIGYYKQSVRHNQTRNKGKDLTESNKEKVSEYMKLEIEFYLFLKARLYYLKDQLMITGCLTNYNNNY